MFAIKSNLHSYKELLLNRASEVECKKRWYRISYLLVGVTNRTEVLKTIRK